MLLKRQSQSIQTALAILFDWLVFPVAAGFLIVTVLAGYLNNKRFPTKRESTFPDAVNALAFLVVLTVTGAVFVF